MGAAQHRPLRRRPSQRDPLTASQPAAYPPWRNPPGARELFGRAIVESGTHILTQQPLATAEAAGAAFAAKAGCAGNTAACLRALDAIRSAAGALFCCG